MSKEIEEDISIIKNIIYFDNERVSYIDIDDFCDNECEKFIQAIESILKDNEANKKKIEELEEEKCMVLQRRNGKTTKLAMQLREELLKLPTCKLYGIKNCKGKSILLTKDEVIPKAKLEEMLKTKIIDYDCEDCITGKFIEVKDIKELLKDGGE